MRLALLILFLLLPTAAHADPVTTAVAAFAAWAGTTAAVVYTVAAVGLSAGVAVYGSAQARKAERQARDATNAALKDRMTNKIGSEAPHRYVYGRAKVGGSVVAMFTTGDKDQYRHIVTVHANHECDGIEEVFVNNVAVGVRSSDGDATTGRFAPDSNSSMKEETKTGPTFTLAYNPLPGTVRAYRGAGAAMVEVAVTSVSGNSVTVGYSGAVTVVYARSMGRLFDKAISQLALPSKTPIVRVQLHLGGATDPVDTYLNSAVPSQWPATSVLRSMCYTVVTLDLNHKEFQNGQVPIHVLLRGKKLYDPRTSLTTWSANPALAIYDYLTSPLCDVDAADLPVAEFITAANVCDEVVDGGARYTINGDVSSDQPQASVLGKMAECMAGGLVSTTWSIYAGKYVAPVMALSQADIVGNVQMTPGASDADIYNGVKGQYVSAETKYVLTDFKPYQNAAYRADDARDLYTDIDFPFTDSLQRVTNLCRIFTEDQRNGFTMRAEFSLKAWPLKVGQRVTFTSELFGQTAKVYRITDKAFAPNSAVQLTLKEDAAEIWDFADAVVVDATPNTDLPDPWEILPLASLSITSGDATLLRQPDGSTVPRMLVTWPLAPTLAVQDNGQIEIEWRAVGSATWSTTTVPGDATEAYLAPVTPGWAYVVRARCTNPYIGTQSNWVNAQYQVQVFTARATVYKWSDTVAVAPSGLATWTWGTSSFGAAPTGWSLTAPVKPTTGPDTSLYAASVLISDVSNTSSTSFQWSAADISVLAHAPVGAASTAVWSSVTGTGRPQDGATAGAAMVLGDFSAGFANWTRNRHGAAATIPTSGGTLITTDTDFGTCGEISDFTVAGNNILTKAMVAIVPGRVYRISATYKVIALPGDGATRFNLILAEHLADGVTANGFRTSTDTHTVSTVGTVMTLSMLVSTLAVDPGVQVFASPATMFFRAGLRNQDSESAAGTVRLKSIIVEDVTTARAAQYSSELAISSAASANAKADAIVADGVLDRSEKIDLISDMDAAAARYTKLTEQAAALAVSSAAFTAARNARDSYLVSLDDGGQPAWDDITQNTNITRATFRTKFTDYAREEMALANAIAAKAAAIGQAGVDAAAIANEKADAIAADSKLDRSEKAELVRDAAAIVSETTALTNQAAAMGVSSTAFTAARTALDQYLVSLFPVWNDTSADTVIVRADFNTAFSNYHAERAALSNAITAKAATQAEWISVTGGGKPADNATVGAPVGTNVGSTPAETVEARANGAIATPVGFTLTGTFGGVVSNSTPNTIMSLSKNLAATVGGALGTVTYAWAINPANGTGGIISIANATTATPTVSGKGKDISIEIAVTCTVTDSANGLSRVASGLVTLNIGNY